MFSYWQPCFKATYSIGTLALNDFEWISTNLSKSASFSLLNIRKQPQTSLESIKKANKSSIKYGH